MERKEFALQHEEFFWRQAPARSLHHRSLYFMFAKRAMDIALSGMALVLLFPLMLVVALVIVIDDPHGAPIFAQKRVGKNGGCFMCYKFRSMKMTAPHDIPTCELINADWHITRFGRIIRRTSIDELPQLINVLRGDMSIVGPRPLIPCEEEIHKMRAAAGIYRVKPGLTGFSQVSGRDLLTDDEKVSSDLFYIRNISLWFDAAIVLRTILCVITGDGIREGKQAEHKAAC